MATTELRSVYGLVVDCGGDLEYRLWVEATVDGRRGANLYSDPRRPSVSSWTRKAAV